MIDRRTFLRSTAGAATFGGMAVMATLSVAVADPMSDLIARYREQLAIWTAAPCTDDETDDLLAQATYDPLYNRLMDAPPAIASDEGAVAALKLASADQLQCSPMALAMVTAVLAHLEERG